MQGKKLIDIRCGFGPSKGALPQAGDSLDSEEFKGRVDADPISLLKDISLWASVILSFKAAPLPS